MERKVRLPRELGCGVPGGPIAVEGFWSCRRPGEGSDERLASLERGLEHVKAGLGLLGVKPCSWCGIFYRRSDAGALFDCGEVVCFDCGGDVTSVSWAGLA